MSYSGCPVEKPKGEEEFSHTLGKMVPQEASLEGRLLGLCPD